MLINCKNWQLISIKSGLWLGVFIFIQSLSCESQTNQTPTVVPATVGSTQPVSPSASSPTAMSASARKLSEDEAGVNGNWVKKVNWLRQASAYKTEIDELFGKIIDLRKNEYEKKIAKTNERMAMFYKNLNAKRGDLASLLEISSNYLEKKVKKLTKMSKDLDATSFNEKIKFKA